MSDYILQTKGLTKKFKNQIVVDNTSLSIRKNSVFGLLGPNGACTYRRKPVVLDIQGFGKI